MERKGETSAWKERRSEPRTRVEPYHSAEFVFEGKELHYQFKIWDIAAYSMCVLVKESSEVLPLLHVGETLKVKYYSSNCQYHPETLQTIIRHITRNDQGRFKGHYLVGLETLMEESCDCEEPEAGKGDSC